MSFDQMPDPVVALRRRDLESEVERTARQQRQLFFDSLLPMWVYEVETLAFLEVNRAAVRHYGWPETEFLAMRVSDVCAEEDANALFRAIPPADAPARRSGPWRHRTSSGAEILVEILSQPYSHGGRPARLVTVLDVTEHIRALEALQRERDQFKAIAEHSPDVISRFDRGLRYLFTNPAQIYASGFAPEQLIGRTHEELGRTEIAKVVVPQLRAALDSGEPRQFELRMMSPEGEHDFEVQVVPEIVRNGQVETVLAISRDITQRKRAEDAMRESEARFRTLTELSSDWYWEQDSGFRFTFMSGKLLEKTGIAIEQHIGRTRWELPTPSVTKQDWARHRAQLDAREPFRDFEILRVDRDGHPHWVSVSGKPLFGSDGSFVGYRGVGHEITQRKLAEEALRESEARFRLLAEHLREVVWISDPEVSRFHYVSAAFTQMWGEPREELYRDARYWEQLIRPEDLPAIYRAIAAQVRGEPMEVDFRILRRDGETRWLTASSQTIISHRGERLTCGIIEDITERTEQAQQRLAHALEQRDALVREVHHRIKNHLQGVAGLLHNSATRNPEAAFALEKAVGQVQSIAIVHGLHGARSGRTPALGNIIQAVGHMLDGLTGVRFRLTEVAQAAAAVCLAEGDAVPVALVLNELMMNAAKHSTPGESGTEVSIALESLERGAQVTIRNRGRLPPGFDFAAGRGMGNGLALARVLLPREGIRVEFEQSGEAVSTRLQVVHPTIIGGG
jgi:PAS domain S-box-containing protein